MHEHKHASAMLTTLIVLLSLAGAWISGELLEREANVWGTGVASTGLFARVCAAGEQLGFNCGNESGKAWSGITIPVPLASLGFTATVPAAFAGLAYFVFLGVWFGFIGGPRPHGRGWHWVVIGVVGCGAIASVYYIGLMALGYAPRCLWCLATHMVNFAIVLTIWRLYRNLRAASDVTAPSSPDRTGQMTLTFREAAGAVVFSLILVAGLWIHRSDHLFFRQQRSKLLPFKELVRDMQNDPAFLVREYLARPKHQIAPRADEPAAGEKAELVVFTDFECPSCTWNSHSVREEATEAFGGQLVVRVRHYPLCNSCNDQVTKDLHANACEAAYAAEAARMRGGEEAYWQMHELLVRHSRELRPELYAELAAEINLDVADFLETMGSNEVRATVQSDIALGRELGVIGTPTLYLNGREIPALCQTSLFWEAAARNWSASRGQYADAGTQRDLVSTVLRSRKRPVVHELEGRTP